MTLIAAPARIGNFLDTDVPLSDAVIADVVANGYQGIYRYVALPGNSPRNDISPGEIERICAAGLQVGLVQHPRAPKNNDLSRTTGYGDAHAAVDAALAADYPLGCHLALDLEGITDHFPATSAALCIQWATDWQSVVRAAGLKAQLYLGYAVPLDADQAYELPGFDSYWSDIGHRKVATRGCAMVQAAGCMIHGIEFDRNVLAEDLLREVPWLCQEAFAA